MDVDVPLQMDVEVAFDFDVDVDVNVNVDHTEDYTFGNGPFVLSVPVQHSRNLIQTESYFCSIEAKKENRNETREATYKASPWGFPRLQVCVLFSLLFEMSLFESSLISITCAYWWRNYLVENRQHIDASMRRRVDAVDARRRVVASTHRHVD